MCLPRGSRQESVIAATVLVFFACSSSRDDEGRGGSSASALGQAPRAARATDEGPAGAARTSAPASDAPAHRALEVGAVTVDAAIGPRDGHGLVAGEAARIGLRIAGGIPPYRIHLRAEPQSRLPRPAQVMPLDTEFQPETGAGQHGASVSPDARADAAPVELAVQASLNASALSGIYRVHATVRDRGGARAMAVSGDIAFIGSDAPVRPAPGPPPFVDIQDQGRRRRRAFVRGERVTVHAMLPGSGPTATITIADAAGAVLLHAPHRALSGPGALIEPLDIPRLARPGDYRVQVTAGDAGAPPHGHASRIVAETTLHVTGAPFAPVAGLTVDALTLHGGADGRTPREGRLRRGERLVIEARIGGGRARVTGALRLHAPDGTMVAETELGPAEIATPAPDTRVFITGTWAIPASIPAGRYQLQVEASEGDHVSARYREVLIE